MNEYVFVDTKHQSPECSFISIEDWNYLLRHDLLKCYKFFLWQEFLFVTRFFPVTGISSYERNFRYFSYDKNDGNFFCDRNFTCYRICSLVIGIVPVTKLFLWYTFSSEKNFYLWQTCSYDNCFLSQEFSLWQELF